MINKTSKVAARSLTAITLIVMIIISCISAVAVNKDTTQTGASKDVESVGGNKMSRNVDYYLVGEMSETKWQTADPNFKLSSDDGNHFTGTFNLIGEASYYFKIYNSRDEWYSLKDGYTFTPGVETVTGLTSDSGAKNMKFKVPAGTTKLTVDMYCEYGNDCQVTFTLKDEGTGGVYHGGDGHSYKAESGVKNHSSDTDLLNVKSTFFDYYTDEEINGTWRGSLTGFYRTVESGNADKAREPYQKFNRAISEYVSKTESSKWTTPLYFGDFNGKNDDYQGYYISALKKYLARPNNSQCTTSTENGSVAGLADVTLADNKKLSKNGVTMPYFDEDWLVNNGYGTVVHSDFPMRKTTKNNQDYYEFNSNDGVDNCYFDNYDSLASGGKLTMNYANNSHKIKDALSGFSSSGDGIGFFPFDRENDHGGYAYDFGFGMRLDIDFTLGAKGKTNGQDTVFNFSGDDDLWVYLDGVLVLDMGGDHKKSNGCINFSTLKSYVNNIDTTYQGSDLVYKSGSATVDGTTYGYSADFPTLFSDDTTRSGSSKFNNNNVNAHHTLTVFYMERGMIESNLKVGFNFEPITDSLDVNKTVDVSNVNDKLQTAVKNADDFGFAIKENNADVSNKKYKYTSNGTQYNAKTNGNTATLADDESASFNSQFTVGSQLTVTEGDPKETIVSNMDTSNLVYLDTKNSSCSWFFNNGAVPAISFDGGTTFNQMFSYTVDGRTVYYYESEKDSNNKNKDFIIGRKDDKGIWNKVKYSAITDSANCVNVKAWRTTKVGDTSVADNNSTISDYVKFASNPPSDGSYTIDTTKKSKLTYDTNWTLYDVSETPNQISSGSSKESSFKYINDDDDDMIPTHLRLDYVNTPKVADIKVNKIVVDEDGNQLSDYTQFDVTLKLDLKGGTNYQDYGLTGTVSQNSSYKFEKIPVGASYEITESTPSGYKVSYGTTDPNTGDIVNKNTGTLLNEDGATVDVVNTVTPASIAPEISKTLDGEAYTGTIFSFSLKGIASTTVDGVTTVDTSSYTDSVDEVTNGKGTFKTIKYNSEGTYLYKITEDDVKFTDDYQKDTSVYILKVEVTTDPTTGLVAEGKYYKGTASQSPEKIVEAGNEGTVTFANNSTKGQITVLKVDKVDEDGNPTADANRLKGAEFTLYKVDDDGIRTGTKVESKTTDSNGEVTFTDLDIFVKDNNGQYKNGSDGNAPEYQWYYVVETAATAGYTLADNQQWFNFEGANFDTTKNCYTHSFVALNTHITVPYAGINYLMQHNFILYGTLVLGLGAICSCGYMLRKRRLGAKAPTNKHGRK